MMQAIFGPGGKISKLKLTKTEQRQIKSVEGLLDAIGSVTGSNAKEAARVLQELLQNTDPKTGLVDIEPTRMAKPETGVSQTEERSTAEERLAADEPVKNADAEQKIMSLDDDDMVETIEVEEGEVAQDLEEFNEQMYGAN